MGGQIFAGLLLVAFVPVATSVDCYQCYGEDTSYDPADKGDLDCLYNPTKMPTTNCSGVFCAKVEWSGKAEGVDVKGAARGCDTEKGCKDGLVLSHKHEVYTDITVYVLCSRGDLTNRATIATPLFLGTAGLAALAELFIAWHIQ